LPAPARAALGQHALQAQTVSESERLAVIAHRLAVTTWPERALLITAVDAEDGRFVTWNRDSGVELPLAVASSCAVPMVWPPATINGRRYIDGGVRSPTNADVAVGYPTVVVIAPVGASTSTLGPWFSKERQLLEARGATVAIVEPDAEALAAFGPNVLDPAYRHAAAEAGLRQAASATTIIAHALAV
jgi:NTE family protein